MWIHLILPFAFSSIFFLHLRSQPLQLLIFFVGLWIGYSLIIVDRILHACFVEPDTEFSLKIQHSIKKRQVRIFLHLLFLEAANQQAHLITRSTLFMASYMAIAIYVVTSSTSLLGIGLVLGIGLHYCLDLLIYHANTTEFIEQFFWQLKRKFQTKQVSMFVAGFLFYFVMLSLLAFRS